MKKLLSLLLVALLVALPAQAQWSTHGPRGTYAEPVSRGAYIVSVTGQSFTAVESLINLESSAGKGFRITKLCIQPGSQTTAAYNLWQLIRTTTASSGGTLISNEATSGSASISKLYASDADFDGIGRIGGTEGTSGAIIDQGSIFVGTATTANMATCIEYCTPSSTMCPTVEPFGTGSPRFGVKLMFTAAAGGASQGATMYIVAE